MIVWALLSDHREALLATAGSLALVLIGTWVADGRVRRDKAEEVIAPFREQLLVFVSRPSVMRAALSETDFRVVEPHLSRRNRRRLREALDRYQACAEEQQCRDSLGGVYYVDAAAVAKAAEKMLEALKPR